MHVIVLINQEVGIASLNLSSLEASDELGKLLKPRYWRNNFLLFQLLLFPVSSLSLLLYIRFGSAAGTYCCC